MKQRTLVPPGTRVRLALLGRNETGRWRALPDRAGEVALITEHAAIAVAVTGHGHPVYCGVIAVSEFGEVTDLADGVSAVDDAKSIIGEDGSMILARGDVTVAVVLGADRGMVAEFLASAGKGPTALDLAAVDEVLSVVTFSVEVRPAREADHDAGGAAALPPSVDVGEPSWSHDVMVRDTVGYLESIRPSVPGAGGSRPRSAGSTRGTPAKAAAPRRPRKSASRAQASAESPPEPVPMREVYGRLEAPDAVVADVQFEVVVGLGAQESEGAAGGVLEVPKPSAEPYEVTVLVLAGGCDLAEGESWRNTLSVSTKEPYPAITLHLTAEAFAGGVGARTIQALYSIGGASIGMAVRAIAIVSHSEDLATQAAPAAAEPASFAVPSDYPKPDLEIRIFHDPTLPIGTLSWDVVSPHKGVQQPDAPVRTSIGSEPQEYAARMIEVVRAAEGTQILGDTLLGFGAEILAKIPTFVTDALTTVAAAVRGRVPTVLILSEEPHIPWELAAIEPPINPAAPPYLGAQAVVGRWVLGNRKPVHPPPVHLAVKDLAVVSGVFDLPGAERLEHAEKEAADLAREYGAAPVNADLTSVRAALDGSPPAELLHFAVHGKFDPEGYEDGLILVDGTVLAPRVVRGRQLKSPFVFLNACQVGVGSEVLGDYAGMAAAFLYAGASGAVAPLWSIDDELAGQIAMRFYAAVFSGVPVGEAIRRERASFAGAGQRSATLLAYQFFGHPTMTLTRTSTEVSHG